MRLLFTMVMLPVTLAVVDFAVSNREPVALQMWPLPYAVELPVYMVALGMLLAGFVLGAFVAWATGLGARRRARADAREQIRARAAEAESLERELAELRRQTAQQAGVRSSAALPAPGLAGALPPR
ncbi:MAG: LapA family protein [Alphaproteobacteria bacterium]|nr:LapA family protein [Alphaproteobacteria bacterium]